MTSLPIIGAGDGEAGAEARQTLRQILATYGPDVRLDPRRCAALLRDLCPTRTLEVNLLLAALRERVPDELLAAPPGQPVSVLAARLSQRLVDTLGLTGEAARWAVGSWALALGLAAEADLPAPAPPPPAYVPPPQYAPPAPPLRPPPPPLRPPQPAAARRLRSGASVLAAAVGVGLLVTIESHHSPHSPTSGTSAGAPTFPATSPAADPAGLPALRWEADKPVSSIALSRDGRTLATGGFKLVTLWDTATGKKKCDIAVLPPAALPMQDGGISIEGPQPGEVARLCFSPDGERLAGSDYGAVTVWDAQTGRKEMTPKMPATEVQDMTIGDLPGGGMGQSVSTRQVLAPNRAVLQFSPDGRTLVADADGSSLVAWDIGTGKRRSLIAKTDAGVLAFSPDGKVLAGGGSDGVVHLWDAATGRERRALRVASKSAADDAYGHTQYFLDVNAIAFSPDGRTLATAHQGDTNVRFWDAATAAPKRTVPTGVDYVTSMALRPDGSFVCLQGGNGVALRDGATGKTLHSFLYKAPGANANSMFELYPRVFAMSADGQTLAAAGNGNRSFDLDGKAVAVWKVTK